ncbi:hypothetical protein PVAP13_9KG426467 [Panicum virgatum]|uniref:Uncharacterized protein n=1 Tax=Panicum virgatum TaxID=38727 RepID=A0A8T0NAQ2_PANVG|nr:hypothetical protein PVAP13_9KG426467 [Panicum virgatum]
MRRGRGFDSGRSFPASRSRCRRWLSPPSVAHRHPRHLGPAGAQGMAVLPYRARRGGRCNRAPRRRRHAPPARRREGHAAADEQGRAAAQVQLRRRPPWLAWSGTSTQSTTGCRSFWDDAAAARQRHDQAQAVAADGARSTRMHSTRPPAGPRAPCPPPPPASSSHGCEPVSGRERKKVGE